MPKQFTKKDLKKIREDGVNSIKKLKDGVDKLKKEQEKKEPELKKMLSALKGIGKEMNKQDNRATHFPLFVIQVDRWHWVSPDMDYDEIERKEEQDGSGLCKKCEKLFDNEKELPMECDDCHWQDRDNFEHYKVEQEFDLNAGVFLTAKACDEHIRANSYHYKNPKSYGISAWRNYEMQAVMRYLSLLAGDKIAMPYS